MMTMRKNSIHVMLLLAAGACTFGAGTKASSSVFDAKRTVFGFFPSPTRLTIESVFATYSNMASHADVVLHQPNIPWKEFLRTPNAKSQTLIDLSNQMIIGRMNGLDAIFVVDPLNGLNRREFKGLPLGWKPKFSNRDVRAAFTNFTIRILREFKPRYLGLASEVNTYIDTHPDDFSAYVSLYKETYALIKRILPTTQVFVTFQWEDLNNLVNGMDEGRKPYATKWELVEAFEPMLDVWAISSYPFVAFKTPADIPANYYTPLLARTKKPLAVAEGGHSSASIAVFNGSTNGQIEYLRVIQRQLAPRLKFWIYLIINDLDMKTYGPAAGHESSTLNWFSRMGFLDMDGNAKPSLAVWDDIRAGR